MWGVPMNKTFKLSIFFTLFVTIVSVNLGSSAWALGVKTGVATSPDGKIIVNIEVNHSGIPQYSVKFNGELVVEPSRLGIRFKEQVAFDEGLKVSAVSSRSEDNQWEQPWGERRLVRDHYNETSVTFSSDGEDKREFTVRFKVFNDGIGFRYEVPEQEGYEYTEITNELTEFRLQHNSTAWWIPARKWNRYEYLYETTHISKIDRAHTPMTLRTPSNVYMSIHEAALVDYSGMSLDQGRLGLFKADLAPWSDGVLVKKNTPFHTPWRTIQISEDAVGLLNSDLILNLNEPNVLGDVSWVSTGKYVGIWWGMHIRDRSWGTDGIHGATTEETKLFIDFAAKYGFSGVLVEGWNTGWNGSWYENGDVFSFTESYPDYDIDALRSYSAEKGVPIIGHHETSGSITNYENQMHDSYALFQSMGIKVVKSGYVADGGGIKRIDENGIARYEWHDGQFMANHYLYAVKEAAKYHISVNAHEPIKDTGLRRTYPNMVAREGARGQEYNAWAIPPNPPEHTTIIPFTRMLSGPMDFTPGIFDLTPSERPPLTEEMGRHDVRSRVETTLAKQLALYVVLYSPIQMAADLPENYEARLDAFQFIVDVPTDWEESIAIAGEIGDYVAFARKDRAKNSNGEHEWYIGALSDEEARVLDLSLSFLDADKTYKAEIYRDGPNANWKDNPYDIIIEEVIFSSSEKIHLPLAAGGGAAVRFIPQD